MVGFWSGRSIRWKMEETEETGGRQGREKKYSSQATGEEGVTIGSPVNGEIRKRMEETAEETADAGTGCISIVPEDGKVYAPTAGKVLKLYPMGNRIRFRTDSGLELLLNICRDREELHSAYYHCNVLQNEIVRKGKLLMEFDQEGLAKGRRGYGGDGGNVPDPGRDRSSVPGKIISGQERNFCGYSVREGIRKILSACGKLREWCDKRNERPGKRCGSFRIPHPAQSASRRAPWTIEDLWHSPAFRSSRNQEKWCGVSQ